MKSKELGNTGLQISPIIFGGNVFGWTLDEKESFKMLDEVLDKGFNTIDTADSYSHWAPGNSGGESETIIGKWLKERGNRDKIVLATKVGSNPGKEGRDVSNRANCFCCCVASISLPQFQLLKLLGPLFILITDPLF